MTRHWKIPFGAASMAIAASAAGAAPSVFIKADATTPFWNGTAEARILGKNAGRVTADVLSKYLADTMLYGTYAVCALEAASADSFVGLDRESQAGIDAYRPHATWRAEATAPGGRRVIGQSVLFESCDGELKGAALLVSDAATAEILRWEPLGNGVDDRGHSVPSWVMFIKPAEGDELFGYSGCTECGARTNVYYDVTREKIYTEYNGH